MQDSATTWESHLDLYSKPLAITINHGLRGLAEEVIPQLARDLVPEVIPDLAEQWGEEFVPTVVGFSSYYFPDITFVNESIACLQIDVGMKNTQLHVPVSAESISGFFGNNGKVFVDIDIDTAFETTLFSDIEEGPGFNACDVLGAVDNFFDGIVRLFGGNTSGSQTPDDISYEELTATAEGLEGNVDFTLELAADHLAVASVDTLDAEPGALNISGTSLATWLAAQTLSLFGTSLSASDLTDFANDAIDEVLGFTTDYVNRVQLPALQEVVDDALQQNLAIEEAVAFDEYQATIEVSPANLTSSRSENTMTMEFGFTITSDVTTHACASNLSRGTSHTIQEALTTSSDFDLKIPHWILAHVLYEVGRQGLFCQETLMTAASEPWTVRPNGALTVANAYYTTEGTLPSGFSCVVCASPGRTRPYGAAAF